MNEQVIPVLHVANAADAVAWYERLGFSQEWEHRFDPDCPVFVSIARGPVRLYLSEHRGDAGPDTLVHLVVADVDAVVSEFGRPADEPPYGSELELRDPDGNRLRFNTARG
jgi:catechol 2,3-dioxygenase-like lactoylglutathione lyase family enzyme